MAFVQSKLERSINQSRGIYDKFIYKTTDAIASVVSPDYFALSRFAGDPDWEGGIIEAECSDGYVIGRQSGGTLTALVDSTGMAPSGYNIQCTTVLNVGSQVNQNPAALDTPLQISYGPAFGGPSDPVQVDAAGLITVNQSGCYTGVFYFQVSRTGAAGTSHVWIRFLINGVQQGTPQRVELNAADDDVPVSISFERDLPAGTTVSAEVMRDSAGNNSGGLVSAAPTALPWNNTDSASVTIVKLDAVAVP